MCVYVCVLHSDMHFHIVLYTAEPWLAEETKMNVICNIIKINLISAVIVVVLST